MKHDYPKWAFPKDEKDLPAQFRNSTEWRWMICCAGKGKIKLVYWREVFGISLYQESTKALLKNS
jgi:hypothetical protein